MDIADIVAPVVAELERVVRRTHLALLAAEHTVVAFVYSDFVVGILAVAEVDIYLLVDIHSVEEEPALLQEPALEEQVQSSVVLVAETVVDE